MADLNLSLSLQGSLPKIIGKRLRYAVQPIFRMQFVIRGKGVYKSTKTISDFNEF